MRNILFTCSSKNKKINNLIKTIKDNKKTIVNKILILELIENGCLNKHIKKINDCKISILKSPLVPKGYLTGYEQFISILDNFITYFTNLIESPELKKNIISNCLENSNILLSTKYLFDIENIEFYKYNFSYAITHIFYENLIELKDKLKDELSSIDLDMEKLNIEDKENCEYLTTILGEIIFINKNDYKLLSLFTKIKKQNFEEYIIWYKMMLSKYIKNIDFINKYREFKETIK